VVVDEHVEAALRDLTALAPLHQPKSLAALDAVRRALPNVPEVACFDTAFHATLPPEAATYALPRAWRERYGVRRYGFHGLSHAYAARAAGDARRVVTCHLGAGASLCAVLDGRSVDTTMGFTPLEGLVMATRSGSVDPGLLLWLLRHEGISSEEMADALEHESGLLGIAGTADMRELLARNDPDAQLALGVYIHRLRAGIAAMVASLGGLDALVFTGGVGERAARVRELACAGLEHLGVGTRAVRVFTVEAREDLEIARQSRALIHAGGLEPL
jgi:acetate kinase